MLDLGANVNCTPEQLLQFAAMGSALVAAVDGIERPTIGLLNIGEEDIKGNDVVKQTAELLKASTLNFFGNVEGDDIYKGTTDVVVCDGFVGNVVLKTSEGLAQMLYEFLKAEFTRNLADAARGRASSYPVLMSFKRRIDPRRYNGATLVGLKGVVVKSHGGADVFAFAQRAAARVRRGRARRPRQDRAADRRDAGVRRRTATAIRRAAARPCIAASPAPAAICRSAILTNDELARARRHERRMDSHAHRHPPAAHRRRRRADVGSRARTRRAQRSRPRRSTPADVDLIIVATTTPDMVFPSTACILQAKLGAHGGPAFDVQAVCSGFVYALAIADRMVAGGVARNALVVGAEIYSRILDWNDRGTCVLFGDGAGAVVLVPSSEPGILSAHLHADGRYKRHPVRARAGAQRRGHRHAVRAHGRARRVQVRREGAGRSRARSARRRIGKTPADIDWLIPHQANIRIMDATAKKLGLPHGARDLTVDAHANTSAASVPLALDVAVRDGRIRAGPARDAASASAAASPGARSLVLMAVHASADAAR